MGVGAAVVFPTTLSILTNVYTERNERPRAIGLWGASTGLAVALGPITGGALLESYWWGSTFLVKVPLAVVGLVAVVALVPTSRDPEAPRLDVLGLVLSSLAVGALVHGIIEAPERGWLSTATLLQAVVAVAVGVVFVIWERRVAQPMLDVRTFMDRRFSVSSGAITISFFALAGFIFLITQYFQFLRGYSPLETGLRIVPVALGVAVSSLVGTRMALRLGNGQVVGTGLALLALAYGWVSTASLATSYTEIAAQMLVLGTGMGLTSAPATEALTGAVGAYPSLGERQADAASPIARSSAGARDRHPLVTNGVVAPCAQRGDGQSSSGAKVCTTRKAPRASQSHSQRRARLRRSKATTSGIGSPAMVRPQDPGTAARVEDGRSPSSIRAAGRPCGPAADLTRIQRRMVSGSWGRRSATWRTVSIVVAHLATPGLLLAPGSAS